MPWVEGNLPTGHRTTMRTGLPTVVWRQLYGGVPAGKSTRAQVDDACGMLEARSEVDVDLANLNGNASAFRLQEASAFLEAMNQQAITALFYNDTAVNPERPMGLAPRYSSTSANNSRNILLAGGSGSDNTSVWLICWGNDTVHGIFPEGSKAGIEHKDLGEIDAFDGSNNRYRAFADIWKWKLGLSLRDWRYVVRIANIDISDLVNQTNTQALTATTNILKQMMLAMNTIPFMGKGTRRSTPRVRSRPSCRSWRWTSRWRPWACKPVPASSAPRAWLRCRATCRSSVSPSVPSTRWSRSRAWFRNRLELKESNHVYRLPRDPQLGTVHRRCCWRRGLDQLLRHRRRR